MKNITIKNKYPLLRINDILDQLHGATCFSSIDLGYGNHLLGVRENDIPRYISGAVMVIVSFCSCIRFNQWKCDFCLENLAFLDNIVSDDGIKIDIEKIMQNWSRHTSQTDIRCFLGLD